MAIDDVAANDMVVDDASSNDATAYDVVVDDVASDDVAAEDDENVYLVKVRYFLDDEGNEELQTVKDKFRVYKGKSKKGYKKSYSFFVNVKSAIKDKTDPLLHIEKDKATDCGDENDRGYETKYYDSSDNGSLVGSDANDVNVRRRKKRFPQYNPNVKVLEFYIGMVFKDGK